MADKKISQLTALSAANVAPATDVLAIVDTSATETKKITAKDLIDGALNGGTANGVLYLNGSKEATSGSAFAFNGTDLTLPAEGYRSSATSFLRLSGGDGAGSGANLLVFGQTHATAPGRAILTATGTGYIQLATFGGAATLDSSGNLGIGTASPGSLWSGANRLVVGSGSAAAGLTIYTSTSTAGTLAFGDGTTGSDPYVGYVQYGHTDNAMLFGTGGTTKATLDISGNLGLGVTPSAWSAFKAFEVASAGNSLWSAGSNDLRLATNFVYNLGNKYVANGLAAQYIQTVGQHQWYTAPNNTSGAGASLTFTQALTLDANVNLLLNGTAAPASGVGTFAIFNGTAPTGSVTNGCVLYAEDVSASSELKVRDEAGNVTTLSPHNFSLIPEGASEDMAWAYYSEKNGKRINVDMLKLARMVEKLTGEKLVWEA